jgi:hypothetical protein
MTVDPTGNVAKAQASELLRLFNEGKIDLWADEPLLRDLRAARIQERSAGGCRVVSPRDESGHGDSLSGLLQALLATSRLDHAAPSQIAGELICAGPED